MKQITLILGLVMSLSGFSQTNWTLSNAGMYTIGYADFAIAPNGDVYAVGAAQTWQSYEPVLSKSTDNGNNWNLVNIIDANDIIIPTSIIFSGNKMLMCGKTDVGKYSVFSSTDFGKHWIPSGAGIDPQTTTLNDFAMGPDGYVYLVGTKPLPPFGAHNPIFLKSPDNGASWIETPSTGITGVPDASSIIFDAYGKMYFSGASSVTSNEIYTSTNMGATWTQANTGVPSTCFLNKFTLGNGQEIYAAGSDDSNNGSIPKIMKSTNFGASWTNITGLTGLTSVIGCGAIINANGSLLLADYGYYAPDRFVHRSSIPVAAPVVITSPVNSVTDVSALCEGKVFQDGGVPVTARGICWSTLPIPTTTDQVVNSGFGAGTFTVAVSDLQPLTPYYIRAFATNSVGTSYGSQKSFTTAISSGIRSSATELSLQAYPVPSSDVIYLPVKASQANSVYTVTDGSGKIVLTARLEEHKNAIDISSLPKGYYFLQDEKGHTQKFVKE